MSDIPHQTPVDTKALEALQGGVAPRSPLLTDYAETPLLAQQFGVSQRTVERWVRVGLLPAPLRLGRKSFHHLPSIRKHLSDRAERGSRHSRVR
jgi:hypothetical protein